MSHDVTALNLLKYVAIAYYVLPTICTYFFHVAIQYFCSSVILLVADTFTADTSFFR